MSDYVATQSWDGSTKLTEAHEYDELWTHYFPSDSGTYHNGGKVYSPQYSADEMEPKKLYFAYGSNLHQPQMAARCPDSQPMFPVRLPDWRLEFRGVADITQRVGYHVDGAVYLISKRDEDKLNTYEGYPRMYTKRYFPVTWTDEDGTEREEQCMTYVMTGGIIHRPSRGYFECIAEGFWHWSLDPDTLVEAVKRSGWYEAGVKDGARRTGAKWRTGELSKPVTPRKARLIATGVASGLFNADTPRNLTQQATDAGLLESGLW